MEPFLDTPVSINLPDPAAALVAAAAAGSGCPSDCKFFVPSLQKCGADLKRCRGLV